MFPRKVFAVATAALLALALAGCAPPTAPNSAPSPSVANTFPVTITHAFGETVIPAQPTRVATWGWGSADDAIALGVVPVAIPFQSYGGDTEGVLPWIREAVQKLGKPMPTILPDAKEPPYEAIAQSRPDVILAAYSGVTEEQYRLLSQIAPVVAYPGEPWATDWRELITITGTSLGRSTQAATLLSSINARVAAQADAHPEFAGKSIALASDSGGTFYVYKKQDPRVDFTLDLGFVSAVAVERLASAADSFYYTLSYEQLDKLESDVLVHFGSTQADSDAFLKAGYAQAMSQVKDGAVASPVGAAFIAAVSPPTGLSLTWGLDDYVALLAGAVKQLP